ncbi:MAG: hypothetical protein HN353_13320 [Bdellovibrionales bacterium]|jgi:flagellar motor switch protein FliM|nr:hypothetical protein [Bdellovibrionales bacterium]MBT3524928.1 hypothetical protein [Bdellovibrionales bacterium]MBT7668132.1 hypothetical protein [Bdellovibrionales bacterium]MBT7767447.1 hypothetical protein [Bdellovibrionales bacterium]
MSKNSQKPTIVKYDFANPVIPISKKKIPALDFIHQLFITHLKSELPEQIATQVTFLKGEQQRVTRFRSWINDISQPVVISVIDSNVGGRMAMISDSVFNFEMMGSMLGSSDKKINEISSDKFQAPTKLEHTLFLKIHQNLIKPLTSSWRRAYPLQLKVLKIETNPKLLTLLEPSSVIIISTLKFKMHNGKDGHFSLLYPYQLLERPEVLAGLKQLSESL